jgi:hypothetical protein
MVLMICQQCGGTGASRWGRRPDDSNSWAECEKCKGTGGEMKERSYHFSCGNSSTGSVGLCGRVLARSRDEALEILQEAVTDELDAVWENSRQVEYIRVYIDPSNITINDIDMIDDEDVEEAA